MKRGFFLYLLLSYWMSMTLSAQKFMADGIHYQVTSASEVEVVPLENGGAYSGHIAIPSSVKYDGVTYSVTAIGEGAFYQCSELKYVHFEAPSVVSKIGNGAFALCSNLTDMSLPSTVTSIGNDAFGGTGLYSLPFSDGVTSIGSSAFSGCDNLKEVNIPASVQTIGAHAFGGCENLETVTLAESIRNIEDGTFSGCFLLKYITLPNSLVSIGENAFSNCRELKSIEIPGSVVSIKENAFRGCSLLSEINLPESLLDLGNDVFYECFSLEAITLPKHLESIGNYAFIDCYNLQSVSAEMTQPCVLGEEAFRGTPDYKTLTVPAGSSFFYRKTEGWNNFNQIRVDGAQYSQYADPETNVIYEFNNLENTACVKPGQNWSGWEPGSSDVSQNVTIRDKITVTGRTLVVKDIGRLAFHGKQITSLSIPASIEYIGDYAFTGSWDYIKTITVENETPFAISEIAFSNETYKNAKLYVPEGTENLYAQKSGWRNFFSYFKQDGLAYHVTSWDELTVEVDRDENYAGEIVIPSSVQYGDETYTVTRIGRSAFMDTAIESIVIPKTITGFDSGVFAGCRNLTSITVHISDPRSLSYNGGLFSGGTYVMAELHVPVGSESLYQAAEYWRNFYNYFEVDGLIYQVTSEAERTAELMNGFYAGDIVIPETIEKEGVTYTVTEIERNAFRNCEVTAITIPATIGTIGEGAFNTWWLKNVTCLRESPIPFTESYTFYDETYENGHLFVPEASKSLYAETEGWNNFKNIFAIGDVTDFEADDIYYVVTSSDAKTVEVTRREQGYSGDIVIPEEVTYDEVTYRVTSIGNHAFGGTDISSLILPSSIISIGDWAFSQCYSLGTVTSQIEVPFEIPYSAFEGIYNRATLRVPVGTRDAYANTYPWNCFTTIVVDYEEYEYTDPETNVIYVYNKVDNTAYVKAGENWQAGCPDVSGDVILLDHFTVDEQDYTVTAIGKLAFYNRYYIKSLTIPATIVSIGQWAFWGILGQPSIHLLAEEPFEIPDDAFSEYSYWRIPLQTPEGTEDLYAATPGWRNFFSYFDVDGVCYHVTSWEELTVEVTEDRGDVFYSGEIKVPASVEHRGQVFNVTHIAEYAFSGRNVTKVELPATLMSIGNGAFNGSLLTEIVLPENLSTIGGSAFGQCSQLATITLLNPLPFEISDWTFDKSTYMTATLILPAGSEDAYKSTPGWRNFFTYFKEGGLSYHITSWTVPAVELVEGDYPSSVVVPASVEHAGQTYQVTGIGQYAFNRKVHEVTIPASVTAFDTYAFASAENLGIIYSQIRNPFYFNLEIYNDGFYESIYLIVPEGCVDAYRNTEGWSNFTHIYDAMPTSITVTVNTTMATFASPLSLDFTDVEGLKAYIVTSYDATAHTATAQQVDKVPAVTGVLLIADEPGEYQIPVVEDAGEIDGNLLKGVIRKHYLQGIEEYYDDSIEDMTFSQIYILANGSQGIGFYLAKGESWVSDGGYLAAGKAYLQLSEQQLKASQGEVKGVGIVFDDGIPTGLDSLFEKENFTDENWYTIDGQRLGKKPAMRGVFIHHGHKVIVK